MSEASLEGKFQIVILHLSNNLRVHGIVPAFAAEGDHVGVHHIQLTEPRELPDNVIAVPLMEWLETLKSSQED